MITRFKIGDQIQINNLSQKDWTGDWFYANGKPHGPFYISGVQFTEHSNVMYTISENWPPRDQGDFTDGFQEEDLIPFMDSYKHYGENVIRLQF